MQAVPSEFLAIDRKERANKPFCDLDLRPAKDRTRDFDDVVIEFTPERAMREASRCVHCPDPAPCMLACPAHNDIPSAMWLIEQGKFIEAAQLYHRTSSLPEICGRVCPHEQLCQGSCVHNKDHEPVLCGELEAFTVDFERRSEGYLHPRRTQDRQAGCPHRCGPCQPGLCRYPGAEGPRRHDLRGQARFRRSPGLRHPQFQALQVRLVREVGGIRARWRQVHTQYLHRPGQDRRPVVRRGLRGCLCWRGIRDRRQHGRYTRHRSSRRLPGHRFPHPGECLPQAAA